MEKWSDFDKLVRVIQHGLQGVQVKKSNISQHRQNSLIIVCRSESVASIIVYIFLLNFFCRSIMIYLFQK